MSQARAHSSIGLSEGADFAVSGYRGMHLGPASVGGGPRTLLLHGFTGLAEDWLDCWPRDHPALALDLPGHGGSAVPHGGFDAALRGLLEALPASVEQGVGYSLGGRVALGLLRLAPERFGRVVILSAHPGLSGPLERQRRRSDDRRWIGLLERQGIAAFVDAWERLPLFATQTRVPAGRLAQQRRRRLGQRADALAASLRVQGLAEMPDMRLVIARAPASLHWIAGLDDWRFSALALLAARARPSIACHLLPGVGHNPLLEAPDNLCRCLRKILAARVGGTSVCHGDR